jgi:DNA polymerase
MNKNERYRSLVENRKACHICIPLDMINPSRFEGGQYDTSHIGPWTQWYGCHDADIMIVGQDWGGREYFKDKRGQEPADNPTNVTLQFLLESIGYEISLPTEPHKTARLFFTNAVLCLKPGRLTGSVKTRCFTNCGVNFLKPQIEIIRPKVVVTLGFMAYKAVMRAYNRQAKKTMRQTIGTVETLGSTILVPVYHCGYYGLLSRPLVQQKSDWQLVLTALNRNMLGHYEECLNGSK